MNSVSFFEQIHIIDTPGFGDTEGGLEYDATVLANISKLFEEKSFFPTVIVLTVNITDKRLEGKFAPFVKLLRAIKQLLPRFVLDTEHPNLLVVLTHLCSLLPKKLQRDPTSKKEIIKKLVHENIGIVDVPVEVAENMFEEHELQKVGDYYKLSNEDLFPRNIYESILKIAKGKDPVGHGLVNEAYLKLESEKLHPDLIKHSIKDIPSNRGVVEDLMRLHKSTTTELGDLLSSGWKQLTTSEMSNCRMTPTELAEKLSILGYEKRQDLPKTKKDSMKFFREIAPDNQMEILLKKSLGLEAPTITADLLIGRGFDLTKDCTTDFIVMSAGNLNLASVGCYLPESVAATACNEVKFMCNVADSTPKMIEQRLKELKIGVGIGKCELNFNQRDGYNIISKGSSSKMTAIYEKHLIKLEMRHDSKLSEELKTAVKTLPSIYDKHSEENIGQWQKFFNTFGTHYINTSYIGGSVVFDMTDFKDSSRQSNSVVNQGGLSGFLGSVFGSNNDSHTSSSFTKFDQKSLGIIVHGGNASKASELALSSTEDQFIQRLAAWEETLWDDPIVTDSSVSLVAVADAIGRFHPIVGNGMKHAASDLYNGSLEYAETVEPTRAGDSAANKVLSLKESSNCLTEETLISTPTGSKAITVLKSGDYVLGKNGRPSRVIGVNKVYPPCCNTYLFGFKNSGVASKPFFTNGHTFLHPSGNILVQNKSILEVSHPQMKTEFKVMEMPLQNIDILSFDNGNLKPTVVTELICGNVKEEQELYYLAVEGDGTYIANGFVCYHELPKFAAWPQTFAAIFESVKFLNAENSHAFTKDDFNRLMKLSLDIKFKWEILVKNNDTLNDVASPQMTFNNSFENALSYLEETLNNAHQANLGMMLYSSCGELLYRFLDAEGRSSGSFIKSAQEIIAREFSN